MSTARAAWHGAAPVLACAAPRRVRCAAPVSRSGGARVSFSSHRATLRAPRAAPEPSRGTLDNLDAILGTPAAPLSPPPPAAAPPCVVSATAPSSAAGEDAGDTWAPFPVPWDWPVLVAAVLGVQGLYFVAATLAPLLVLTSEVDTVLSAFPELRDGGGASSAALSAFLNAPERFWRVLLAAELLQTSAGALLLVQLLAPYFPLPPGVLALRLRPDDADEGQQRAPGAAAARERSAAVAAAFGARELPRAQAPPRPPPPVQAGPAWAAVGAGGAAAAVATVAALAAAALLLGLRGGEGASSTGFVARAVAGGTPGLAALALATCVLAPVFEETVYRGVLLASLTRWMPAPAAVAASAALFAAAHQQGAADSAQLLAMGAIAGVAYCKTRNLATPMLVHALFNSSVLGLYAAWVATAPPQ